MRVRWEEQKVGDKEVGRWLGDGSDRSVCIPPAALEHQHSECKTVSCYGARGSDAGACRSGERAGVRARKHLCNLAEKAERSSEESTPKQAWSHCLQLCSVPAVHGPSCAWLQLHGDPAVWGSSCAQAPAVQGSSCELLWMSGGPSCAPLRQYTVPAGHVSSCAQPWLCGTAAGHVSSCLGPSHELLQLPGSPVVRSSSCAGPRLCVSLLCMTLLCIPLLPVSLLCMSELCPLQWTSLPCTSRLCSVPWCALRCAVVWGLGRWSCTAVQAAGRGQDGSCIAVQAALCGQDGAGSGLSPVPWGPALPGDSYLAPPLSQTEICLQHGGDALLRPASQPQNAA